MARQIVDRAGCVHVEHKRIFRKGSDLRELARRISWRIVGVLASCIRVSHFDLHGSQSRLVLEDGSDGRDLCDDELDLFDWHGPLRIDVGDLASVHRAGLGVFG